jgi:hypothetical protein
MSRLTKRNKSSGFFLHTRASFGNSKAASDANLNLQIATNNQAYFNSKVPIAFYLKCIIDSTYGDSDAEYRRWINSASEFHTSFFATL